MRLQAREDGIGIDQVVVSSRQFLTQSPGALKNDVTILPRTGTAPQAPAVATDDVVLYAAGAPVVVGSWFVTPDASAAAGARLQNPDRGVPKLASALAAPASYFELTFAAEAGRPYRLWVRAIAQGNLYYNDSVYVQFDGSTDAIGNPVNRIGTASGAAVSLEDCSGCGEQGWGWQDNGYGTGVAGPLVYFARSGTQRIRVQVREDGIGVDQIVLSSRQFLSQSPGALKNDATILPRLEPTPAAPNTPPVVALTAPSPGASFTAPASITLSATAADSDGGIARVEFYAGTTLVGTRSASPYSLAWNNVTAGSYALTARAFDTAGASTTSTAVTIGVGTAAPAGNDEIVLYAARAPVVAGAWIVTPDATAAGGARLQNPDAGAAKLTLALAAPVSYFDLTFTAEAGKPYRLWVRSTAQNDAYWNDSVYVQFDGSTDANGNLVNGIGTTSGAAVSLEDCSGCGEQGWGWQDNAYGTGALGPLVYFARSGAQRMRVQVREDGVGVDQVVLSAVKYLTKAPGALKNDTTVLPQFAGR
jgi:hypothetical protein